MRLLGQLALKWKLALVVTALGIPIVVLSYFLVAEKNLNIDFAQKEIHGVAYNMPLRRLQQHLAEHRGMSNAYLSGDSAFKEGLVNKQADIEAALQLGGEMEQKYGALLGTGAKWQAIKTEWDELKGSAFTLSGAESFKQHTALIRSVLDLGCCGVKAPGSRRSRPSMQTRGSIWPGQRTRFPKRLMEPGVR